MVKTIHSRFNEEWEGFPIKCLSLDSLYVVTPSKPELHGKPFHAKLKEDIQKDGLYFPFIGVEVTYEDLVAFKKRYKQKMNDIPEPFEGTMVSIWGGCQRYVVIKSLEYTHVDVALLPKKPINEFGMFIDRYQHLQRAPKHINKRYYNTGP